MKTTLAVSLAVTSLTLGAISVPAAASMANSATAQPLTVQIQSGGRDAASVKRMDAAAWMYDMHLDISGKPKNERWRDVEVTVTSPTRGTVFQLASGGGPLLYAHVPAGVYNVTVKDNQGHKAVASNVHIAPNNPQPIDINIHG